MTVSSGARNSSIRLPPRGFVPKTDADDPVDYYFKPLTARLYRARLRMAAQLLGAGPYESLLEVGYGSGIFLPELALRTRHLSGVDIHPKSHEVAEMLKALGVSADLHRASLFSLPFDDASFDAIVCISVLEHISDLAGALTEFRRVLGKTGIAVLAFPVRNVLTDAFFRLVGYRPREIHPSSETDVLQAVAGYPRFSVEEEAHYPHYLPLSLSAYAGCRCTAS